MQAASITGNRRVQIVRTEIPSPGRRQVRLRVEGCGVCASSLPAWEGREWFHYPLPPGSPGHEGWGVIDEIGDEVESFKIGQRVAFLSERAFAEHDVAAEGSLVVLPDSLPVRNFPGEAFGCGMNIFRRAAVSAGETIAIVGAGFLGNLLIQLAKKQDARVIAISRRASAREIARTCGADETIAMDDHQKILGTVRDLTGGKGASTVIECVGSQWPLDIASGIVAERGRLVIAGYHQDGPRQVNMQQWNWLGIDVINAHERAPREYVRGMKEAVDAILDGRIDPAPLLTHRYRLDELEHAMSDVAERPDGFVKGMVVL